MLEVGTDILRNSHARGRGDFRRLTTVHIIFIIIFVLIIMRTLYLGIVGTDAARRGSGAGQWSQSRADITDRNGEILATNILSGNIVLRPTLVTDKDAATTLIHNAVPEITVAGAMDLINSGRRFLYVKKLASDGAREMIKNAKVAGVDVEETEWRRYPKRRAFSHVVGFVSRDADMRGLEGIERISDKYLRENHDPLVLSLDARIQSIFYDELSFAMAHFKAKGAMGMLMNSRTGEMIAMVALPDYDPENVDLDPVQNRMFMPMRGLYEMGSIFKMFNTAMAMENGISIDKKYYILKPYHVLDSRGRTAAIIHDIASFKPPSPELTVAQIMLYSCNVGSAQIALDLPTGVQREFFERMNFNRALNLDFGRTERPLMPLQWGPVERATVSFGHGISVTPMHTLLAANAMSNGGVYVWPTMFKRGIGSVSGTRVVSPEISAEIRKIEFGIATETSGKNAEIAGINIGGKTATAEKRGPNGKSLKNKNLTAFYATFPIESPEYAMLVILDEPGGVAESFGLRTAAWNAVPTAGKILNSILPLLFQ